MVPQVNPGFHHPYVANQAPQIRSDPASSMKKRSASWLLSSSAQFTCSKAYLANAAIQCIVFFQMVMCSNGVCMCISEQFWMHFGVRRCVASNQTMRSRHGNQQTFRWRLGRRRTWITLCGRMWMAQASLWQQWQAECLAGGQKKICCEEMGERLQLIKCVWNILLGKVRSVKKK